MIRHQQQKRHSLVFLHLRMHQLSKVHGVLELLLLHRLQLQQQK
jgi:hypothetical protein